jgi:AraC-like DNA-binding protein
VVIVRNQITDAAFQYYERLERVREYVVANLEEPLSLADVARVARTERKYFSVFFKKKVGVCFSVWLHHIRLNAAMDLLKSRNHTVTEVASLVGYRDVRTFERNFKRYIGMTPRDFKDHVRPS